MKKCYRNFKLALLSLIGLAFLSNSAWGQLPVPDNFTTVSKGPDEVVLKWDDLTGETGYKLEYSLDSVTWTTIDLAADVQVSGITGLDENTTYNFKVFGVDGSGDGLAAAIKNSTTQKKLVVDIPLNTFVGDTAVENKVDGALDDTFFGQLEIVDAQASGLGIPALKFIQDELADLKSYIRLTNTILPASESLTERTINFWVKNNSPDIYSVPLSIEKRTGMSVVFKDGNIYAFTKHRPKFPAGTDWVADSIGAPWTEADNWAMVTYVFDNPVTRLYVNGEMVGESDGNYVNNNGVEMALPFPTFMQVEAGGDKSAEIGARLDPDAGMVQYLGDSFDPGAKYMFNGLMAKLKMYNFALSAEEIQTLASVPAPASLNVEAVGTDELVVKWADVDEEMGYKLEYSTDSATWTYADSLDADVLVGKITGLTANTMYNLRLVPFNVIGDGEPAALKASTIEGKRVVYMPFTELVGDTAVENVIDGSLDDMLNGQIEILDSATSGLGVTAIKFVQDELNAITSYIRLYETILPASESFTERTINFWVKNNSPDIYSVPLSIEKRTGMGVAFDDGNIYAVTKHRPKYPAGTDWVADSIGAPWTAGDDWAMITYVFDNPVTRLYVNGEMVGESDGLYVNNNGVEMELPFPTFMQIQAGSDKSAEIGALLDPDAGLVQYLGDSWDPGARNMFNGLMAELSMYNYSLNQNSIKDLYNELVVAVEGLSVAGLSPHSIQIKWNDATGETGYDVEMSEDGSTFTPLATTSADVVAYLEKDLTPEKTYWFRVTPVADGITGPATIEVTTPMEKMVVNLSLANDASVITNLVNDSTDATINGTITGSALEDTVMIESTEYELSGIDKIHFTQDELASITSYIRLTNTVLPVSEALTARTVAFWVKNETPDFYSVPISFEKRTGFSIAFKDGKIHAFTKFRPKYPSGTDWVADSTGAVYDYGTEWTHVAYVFDAPVTRLYLNGFLADESDGLFVNNNGEEMELPFVTFIQVQAGGDKSAEIGALLDPDAALVHYLGDGWDPGARNFFSGSMADIKMYNYALSADELVTLRNENLEEIIVDNITRNNFTQVSVYPNPANDVLYMKGINEGSVSIYNTAGDLLLARDLNGTPTINISELQKGLYILKVKSDNFVGISKFNVVK